ncbi:ATP-binding protein [Paenibacillus thalictri]|uniref:ATP-binding protein n=1 Tax=Paenibacillus thalictri TaxID=2527873 RepID=A0A4Q9DCR3_9BACL|nr:ATP-binding protein [Paenibacillus thalictri]TBL68370.1 ATP-binding protein [Paenibacillus thalictri]
MVKKIHSENMYQYIPSLVGGQVEADYIHQDIGGYKDNPFIEALPPIFEDHQVISRIAKYPDYNEEQRKLGKQTRLHLVQQISDYVEPLPSHLLVEQRLSRLIRHGYKARNPLARESIRQFHIGFKDILDAGIDSNGMNIAGVRSTASGFAILGVSGQGKTTAIESSLLLYPQVIHHVEYKGQPFIRKQLVWLKLNCPFDGSLKGLCFNFLQAIDSHLETNYFQKFASKGASVDMLIPIMAHLSTLHGLGVLVIDEIQNLSFMKSGGAERMLNYFTQLINTIGVPVVLIGTFKAMRLLSGSFSQARRSTGQGDLIMDRLTEGEEWDYFLESLWKYQWTARRSPLSGAIKKVMYELSQGIVDIAVKLYMLAQWEVLEAYETGDEKISVGLLKSVAKRHMQLVQPLLKILRRNDPNLLSLVDDLYPEWNVLDQYLKKSSEKVNIQGEIRTKIIRDDKVEQDQEKYIELVKTAIDFGANSATAEQIVQRILQTNEAEKDLVDLRKQVVEEVTLSAAAEDIINPADESTEQKSNKSKTKRKQNGAIILEVDDLRNAALGADKGSDAIYEKLVEMGSIPSNDDISRLII